jgi:preprotein translocase subunit SecA
MLLLQNLDHQWKDHLLAMDHLKEGINLRGYAQKDPKVEYQREGFAMFAAMRDRVRSHTVEQLVRVMLEEPSEERLRAMRAAEDARRRALEQRLRESHSGQAPEAPAAASRARPGPKVGRNDPCTCGSGKKYKKCCGAAG